MDVEAPTVALHIDMLDRQLPAFRPQPATQGPDVDGRLAGVDQRLDVPIMLPPTPAAVDLSGMKVLVVDDVADQLEAEGYEKFI